MPWPIVLLIVGAIAAVVLVVYRVLNGSFRLPEARSHEPRRMTAKPAIQVRPYAAAESPAAAPPESVGKPVVETGTPRCPSCFEELKKRPVRKTKCPHCGEPILVKYRPTDPVKRLVTVARAEEIEREWDAYSEAKRRKAVDAEAAQFGIPPGLEESEILKRMKTFATRRGGSLQTRHYAAFLVSRKTDGRDKWVWATLAERLTLEHFLVCGYREVELRGGSETCPSCEDLVGMRFETEEVMEVRPVPNDQCYRWREYANCCAFWSPPTDPEPDEPA